MSKKQITTHVFDLQKTSGHWMGTIVLTSEGHFFSYTDFGSLNCILHPSQWREQDMLLEVLNIGDELLTLNLIQGSRLFENPATIQNKTKGFAKRVLPLLKEAIMNHLRAEIESKMKTIYTTPDDSIVPGISLGINKESFDLENPKHADFINKITEDFKKDIDDLEAKF